MVNQDFSIFAHDPALRSLHGLTPAGLLSGIARGIPNHLLDAAPDKYRITNMRYTPKKKLVIGLNTDSGEAPVSIRVLPRRTLRYRLEQARENHPQHTFLLDDLCAIAWVFPAERKLKLGLVANRARLAKILQEHRGYRLVGMQLVHFVPEHTFTARVCGVRPDGSTVQEYLKIYYNDDGAQTARIMRQLAGQLDGTCIRVPGNVSYIPPERLLVQPALNRDHSRSLRDSTIAGSLAQLHRLHGDAPAIDRSGAETDDKRLLALLANTFPSLLDDIRCLTARICDELHNMPPTASVLLHGDAHLGNIFALRKSGVGVIDLDKMCRGPAVEDLTTFYAFKLWLRLRRKQPAGALLRRFPDFLQAYNCDADVPVSMRHAYLALARKMVSERIRRGIARGKLSGISELAGFVQIAEQCLATAEQCDG